MGLPNLPYIWKTCPREPSELQTSYRDAAQVYWFSFLRHWPTPHEALRLRPPRSRMCSFFEAPTVLQVTYNMLNLQGGKRSSLGEDASPYWVRSAGFRKYTIFYFYLFIGIIVVLTRDGGEDGAESNEYRHPGRKSRHLRDIVGTPREDSSTRKGRGRVWDVLGNVGCLGRGRTGLGADSIRWAPVFMVVHRRVYGREGCAYEWGRPEAVIMYLYILFLFWAGGTQHPSINNLPKYF